MDMKRATRFAYADLATNDGPILYEASLRAVVLEHEDGTELALLPLAELAALYDFRANMTREELREVLKDSARDLGYKCDDAEKGAEG